MSQFSYTNVKDKIMQNRKAAIAGIVTSTVILTTAVIFNPFSASFEEKQDRIDPENFYVNYEQQKFLYTANGEKRDGLFDFLTGDKNSEPPSCIEGPQTYGGNLNPQLSCNVKHTSTKSFTQDSGYFSDRGESIIPYPSEPYSSNTFTEYGISGPQRTKNDAQSTFALDVDRGSFDIAYGLATDGREVNSSIIRSEEWINAFDYGDKNESETALDIKAETGVSPVDEKTSLVRVNVTASEVEAKKGLNITLVVDVSGSMDEQDKLGLVRSSVALLAKNLDADDHVSIVTFDDLAQVILEPTEVKDVEKILKSGLMLNPGGSTNIEAGLEKAYELANETFDEDKNNVVLLASDGVANQGATTAETIKAYGRKGISLITVGYGMDGYNDTIMEQLANQGDGFYSYLDTYSETEEFFTETIQSMTRPVARDAKTQVTFDPEMVRSYRLIGYENRELSDADFDNENVDAGELGTGHNATALYEVSLTNKVSENAILGSAAVRWDDVKTDELLEVETPIVWTAEASDRLRFTSFTAATAEVLKVKKASPETIASIRSGLQEFENENSEAFKLTTMLNMTFNDYEEKDNNYIPQY